MKKNFPFAHKCFISFSPLSAEKRVFHRIRCLSIKFFFPSRAAMEMVYLLLSAVLFRRFICHQMDFFFFVAVRREYLLQLFFVSFRCLWFQKAPFYPLFHFLDKTIFLRSYFHIFLSLPFYVSRNKHHTAGNINPSQFRLCACSFTI